METVTGNVQLYEEHQPTVDALTREARCLREELRQFAEAYKELNLSDPHGELLQIFARDIHAAHQEFMSRLSFLADNEVRCKADDAAQANEENKRLRIELEQTKKQLQVKEDELRASLSREEKLSTQISTNDTFRNALRNHYNNVCNKELWEMKGFLVILRKFCEWYDGDCKEIDEQLKGVDERITGIAGRRDAIYKEVKEIFKNAKELSVILYGGPRQKIYDAAGNINKHTNNLGACEHNISFKNQQLKDKNEQLNNLVKKGSELSNLLEFLQNNL